MGRNNRILNLSIIFIVTIMVMSSVSVILNSPQSPLNASINSTGSPLSLNGTSNNVGSFEIPVQCAFNSVSPNTGVSYNGNISVLVTFNLSNEQDLQSLLSNLSNPNSAQYHKYLTRQEFESEFAPSNNVYQGAIDYFSSFAGVNVKSYSDHVSILVNGPASQIGKAFNTTIALSSSSPKIYYASSIPSLPDYVGQYVSYVTGLSNSPLNVSLNVESGNSILSSVSSLNRVSGYPSPVSNMGVQYLYGSDMQVAYDEQSLLNVTYPTNQVIATILWSGTNGSGSNVGPFYPADIYAYYNATLPSYEPHAHVFGVPINGAQKPGISSAYDTTGASTENTLDLEMVGSTAPGASIYNVYGPNATTESIDQALAFTLNPNATYSALNNVSVITNSWDSQDYNNTAWYGYMQEAAARGITVLASSGDSGDNPSSLKYLGSQVEFPASMAYDNFGVTSVGGNTLTLNSNLSIQSEIAWYLSSSASQGMGPSGSTGGISVNFSEPIWQLNTEANNSLNGAGRGVPDISAIANNTIFFQTINGNKNYGDDTFSSVSGTSIASPLVAGLIAEMNAVLNKYNESTLGYLNPMLYKIANEQLSPLYIKTSGMGYLQTGAYNSTLPLQAFHDVTSGRNHEYNATYGYDLVTGWGSIDAYNLTMYLLNVNYTWTNYALEGVENIFNLSAFNASSYTYNSTTDTYTLNSLNASIQQNFVIADSLGAPIYRVQNVIQIYGSPTAGWELGYSGWVVYPFVGQCSNNPVIELDDPSSAYAGIHHMTLPNEFVIKTWLSNLNTQGSQMVNFEVGANVIHLPVPAASFIIASHNYSYSWKGKTYYNGPSPNNPYLGGLDPQFTISGSIPLDTSSVVGNFSFPTAGNMSSYIEPYGSNEYIVPQTSSFNLNSSIDEVGETSMNINWVKTGNDMWNMTLQNGSEGQGILSYFPETFNVSFNETGLPSGAAWYVNLSNGQSFSSRGPSILFQEPNGTYTASISSSSNYYSYPSTYSFTVNGTTFVYVFPVTFVSAVNSSLMRAVSTMNLINNQSYKGYDLNLTPLQEAHLTSMYSVGISSVAIDNSSSLLFAVQMGFNTVSVVNLTTGQCVKVISLGTSNPVYSYYDPLNNIVYVSTSTGNITMINAATLNIISNISIPTDASNNILLAGSASGNVLYALGFQGYFSVIDTLTNSVVRTIPLYQFGTESSSLLGFSFSVFKGNAYIVDTAGYNNLIVLNLTTYSLSNVPLPSGYSAVSVVPYGNSGTLMIGGEYSSYELFNTSSLQFSKGPVLNGEVVTSVNSPFSSTCYLDVVNPNLSTFENISIVNTRTNAVVAQIPGTLISISMAFDEANQNIYVPGLELGCILTYAVSHYYKATFSESGLPPGTPWYVNITNGPSSGAISGSTYTFELTNGTYYYHIGLGTKTYMPDVYKYTSFNGNFTVNGKNTTNLLYFMPVDYSVTFTESGLPVNTVWSMTLNGLNRASGPSNGALNYSSISFADVNGTYDYSVANLTKYFTSDYSGSVTVNGNCVTVDIEFEHYAYIAGTLIPGNATLSINGIQVTVTNGKFNFSETPGSYSVVAKENGYKTYYDNLTLSSGQAQNLTISLKTVHTGSSLSSAETYAIIGGVSAAIVIAGLVIFRWKKK